MKTLVAAAVLAAVFASPSFAQPNHRAHRGASNPAAIDQIDARLGRSVIPAYGPERAGDRVGADPDPDVRLELRRNEVSSD
jgi:hypothetical protein